MRAHRLHGVLVGWPEGGATAYLNVQYRAPVPLPSVVLVVATLRRVEGRKVFIDAVMTDDTQQQLYVPPLRPQRVTSMADYLLV